MSTNWDWRFSIRYKWIQSNLHTAEISFIWKYVIITGLIAEDYYNRFHAIIVLTKYAAHCCIGRTISYVNHNSVLIMTG